MRNPILLMLLHTMGFFRPTSSRTSEQHGHVHRDECRALRHTARGRAPRRPRTRRGSPAPAGGRPRRSAGTPRGSDRPSNIFISASTSNVIRPSMSLRAIDFVPRMAASSKPLVGQEPSQRADHAVLGDRVRVLVRVRHAGIEVEVRVSGRVGPYPVADLGDPVVGRAHERPDALVVAPIEHLHDRVEVLEAHQLRARLLLGHVVDTEELVVTEQQSVHQRPAALASQR